jgi:UDP-N-acetylglucosamine transferase subunit ALG13
VASTGGHLDQLIRLRRRLVPRATAEEWVTFDTQQARHALQGAVVHFVPMIKPKDLGGTVRAWNPARHILEEGGFDAVVSTGAAVGLPFLAEARRHSIEAHYIESAARSQGPSLTGRMIRTIPGIHLYSQYPVWAHGRWQFRGSVFDEFRPGRPRQVSVIDKVVVTLGTQVDFGFRRAVTAVQRVLADLGTPSPTVLWQTGSTDVSGLGLTGVGTVPAPELQAAIAEADLVIGHAGVGTGLLSLEAGRCPVLLPRRHAHGEHTDDHQEQIAAELTRRGLAVAADPDQLCADDLVAAAQLSADRVEDPPAYRLS